MSGATLKLRPYQTESIAAIHREWSRGRDTLLVMATGGGKTVVFLALLDAVLDGTTKRGLILAHRKELIEQPRDRLYQLLPHWWGRCGIVMAEHDECDRQITVATVQTLASERRLRRLLAHGPIDYLVTDEAHHAVSDTYLSVYGALKDANPNLKHLGVTATPIRADERGLRQVYQSVAAKYGIRELVRMGYLVPPRWLAIQTAISLAPVRTTAGDYARGQLANVFETANCFDLVVESHRKYAADRQAIAFTVSVDGAHALAETFTAGGFPALAADGTTPKAQRAEIMAAFRRGEVQVLCNCGLWTEGLDVPEVSCIHQVRPTKSDGLYTQMVGRALRTFPGKDDALILDYAPLEARNIVMMGDILGVEVRKEAYIEESQEPGEVIGGLTFDGEVHWLEGNPAEIISRRLDYLDLTPWHWTRDADGAGWMFLGLGPGRDEVDRTLAISPPAETMALYLVAKRADERWHKAYLAKVGSFEELSEFAEAYAEERGNAVLAAKAKRWRDGAASEGQMRFAKRLGVWRDHMTKGECAEAITRALALAALRRGGYLDQPVPLLCEDDGDQIRGRRGAEYNLTAVVAKEEDGEHL